MAKRKKKVEEIITPDYTITGATINDGLCNYSFDIMKGTGEGDTHNVKGRGIVHDDLIESFRKLNVHLACIDDVFKHSGIDITSIEKMENHELTAQYHVDGFKIKGHGDAECIILVGSKSITATGGRISIETPKIPLDELSSYTWYNELKEVSDDVRNEVDLYKQGKCIPPEKEEDPSQLKITDATDEGDDMSDAKVD